MKLRETISWVMSTLQRSLFPYFEECSGTPLNEKQKRLVQILEIVQVEKFVPKTADKERVNMGDSYAQWIRTIFQKTSKGTEMKNSGPTSKVPAEWIFSLYFSDTFAGGPNRIQFSSRN